MSEREPFYTQTPPEERALIVRHPLEAVIDNFRSAYNVGSIFRTADACALQHIHLCGMSAHPPHRKLEKTALGAFDYVPWTYYERTGDAIAALHARGLPVLAVEVAPGAIAHTTCQWPKPAAVVFGNEVSGINEKTLAQCDGIIKIPMQGYKNSINVATAFGIILYEVLRQWNALPPEPPA